MDTLERKVGSNSFIEAYAVVQTQASEKKRCVCLSSMSCALFSFVKYDMAMSEFAAATASGHSRRQLSWTPERTLP
jgi:hypothetical protein